MHQTPPSRYVTPPHRTRSLEFTLIVFLRATVVWRYLASEGYTENQYNQCGTAIVREMNILALPEERWKEKKSGEESGRTGGRRDAGTGSKHPTETTERKETKRLWSTIKSFLHSSPPSEQLSPSISQPLAKSRASIFHQKIAAIKESISLKLHGNPSPFDFYQPHCNELI